MTLLFHRFQDFSTQNLPNSSNIAIVFANSAAFSHHQLSARTFPITSSLPHFTQNFFFLFSSFHCVTEITEIAPKN
jgi:hypothetical protein